MAYKTDNSLQREWNYSEGTLARIDRRGDDCDHFAIEGDFYKLYRGLRVLYVNVLWKISKKEIEYKVYVDEINDLFKKLKALLSSEKTSKPNMFLIEERAFEIRNNLNIILFKEKLSFLETEKKTFDQLIESEIEKEDD